MSTLAPLNQDTLALLRSLEEDQPGSLARLIATLRAGLAQSDPLAGCYAELAVLHHELLKLGFVCSQRVAV